MNGETYRGRPKRPSGSGPQPARHIPWPEIFKHHISLIEGHLKMVDMVRKHTVEGTGNHRTITGCVNRSREMLRDARDISRSFIAPPNQREKVPLGSSSESMYPGYSPADHEYGKAASEYGKVAARARAHGMEIDHGDVEYKIGQAKGTKRKALAETRNSKTDNQEIEPVVESTKITGAFRPRPMVSEVKSNGEKLEEAASGGDNPHFVIDTKPTPVNLPGISHKPKKRDEPASQEDTANQSHKKAKKNHEGPLPEGDATDAVQFEDITEEVQVRLKEKDEKSKRKEKKKRKRESEGEPTASSITVDKIEGTSEVSEKPKKKKSKQKDRESLGDQKVSKKRSGESGMVSEDGEGKKKKRSVENETVPEDGEGKKKKRKKHKESSEAA